MQVLLRYGLRSAVQGCLRVEEEAHRRGLRDDEGEQHPGHRHHTFATMLQVG